MMFVATVSRIEQIQTQMDAFGGTLAAPGAGSAATAANPASVSADGFALALSAAKGATATAGALVDTGVTGQDVVAQARRYIGVPYVPGGATSAGLDCSGLVQRVYADLGVSLPRLVSGRGSVGVEVLFSGLQPGDLISTKGNGHIVIYAGEGKVIHAPDAGRTVTETANWLDPSGIQDIRRIVPAPSSPWRLSQAASSGLSSRSLSPLFGPSPGGSSLSGVSSAQASQLAALLRLGADPSQLGSLPAPSTASQQRSLAALLAGGTR
ncbi:hypothetical protein ATY41_09845 [Leifsonia xyli subsp. xyli]|uniref:NlpC/P60 domain-containing protein n=1 Tax=Leifsonia xyli subsp. xyli TaxID=59736 RepID=A0A1E2SLK2_LEIXY|nr:C40 family peptidase [Leifsonia xyli]ODA90534.1 hypothetical protein ATY41_09845 [Leifsonia xyli subsp. xyli]